MKCFLRRSWTIILFATLQGVCLASSIVVSPSSAQIKPGGQLQFTATGSADDVVLWSLSGSNCSGVSCGVIDNQGVYTAPSSAPNPLLVSVIATSLADLSQYASATVTIGTSVTVGVTVSPAIATIAQGGRQQFTSNVTGSVNTSVKWAISGQKCTANLCGTITSNGLYTAPNDAPESSKVTITASSVAYPGKYATATIDITSAASVSLAVSPSVAAVATGGTQQFLANVKGTTNSSVDWTVTGPGCSGSSCGSISTSGLYTAPARVPATAKITITAVAVAAPGRSSSAIVTIFAAKSQSAITPSSAQVKPGAQVQFSTTLSGDVVLWSLSGGGCAGITCGSINSSGLYTAPTAAPTPAAIVVTATSLLNPSISASTTVTVVTPGQISVTVSPGNAQLNVGAQQQFNAAVTGTSNTAVRWSVSGYSCGGSACGTISSRGLYTAPATAPVPSIVFITATSIADPTQTSTATVTLAEKISVSVTPTSAEVALGNSQQFMANVTGTTIPGVTWSLSGKGCSGLSCGTISSTGLYTAPAAYPGPSQITISATAIADGLTIASATLTIIVPVVVTILPTNDIITVGQQQQFNATVTGSKETTVIWSISGSGCAGTSCGSITSGGLYTAPAKVPSPAIVIVKASAKANPSDSASAVVTISPSNNSKLSGKYAFLLKGFDKEGVHQEAGSFTADGNGHLLSGLEDINDPAGPVIKSPISGTYNIGSDNRGVMTIAGPHGTQTLRFALNLLGTKGTLTSFDQTGVRGSGVIELQDPSAFDPSVLLGGYVLDLTGVGATGERVGALGLIYPDGTSFIAGDSLDVNDGGVIQPTFASFAGSYTVDATGRGTAALSIPGFGGGSFNFAFYIVSANELLMLSVDQLSQNKPIFSGPADLQTGAPFTTASLNGGSVFSLSGTNGSAPDDIVGRFQFDGNSNVAVDFDQNNGGLVTVGGEMTGAYDVELNGRGTLNLNQTDGSTTIWYFYTVSPGTAFVLDASTSSVFVGEMKSQTAVEPFSNSSILGTYVFGSGDPVVFTTPIQSGDAIFDGGSSIWGLGAVAGAEDISQTSSLTTSQSFLGTYSVSGVSNNGRGAILLSSPSGKSIAVWVVSASEFVGLDTDSTTSRPTVLHFEQ